MNLVPIVLAKNEELWIGKVLASLCNVFPHVVMADTGSTDSTREIVSAFPNVHLMTFDNMPPEEVGKCRGYMQAEAKERFGATHVLLVDGDELYPTKYLRFIVDNPAPEGTLGGFTWGIECTELPNGECWMLGTAGKLVGVSRHAFFSVDSKWSGVYPFECPDTFIAGDPRNYYWQSLDPTFHFYHVHQMKRSSKDADVYMRVQKQYQFSLALHPEIVPFEFWLKSREEYRDE